VLIKWLSFHQSRRHNSATAAPRNHTAREMLPVYIHLVTRGSKLSCRWSLTIRPHGFLVDTGAQFTVVDPLLATELHLKTQGSAEVVSVGFSSQASFAYLDLLEAGSHSGCEPSRRSSGPAGLCRQPISLSSIIGGVFRGNFGRADGLRAPHALFDDTK